MIFTQKEGLMKKIFRLLPLMTVVWGLAACSSAYLANTPFDEAYDVQRSNITSQSAKTTPSIAQTTPSAIELQQQKNSLNPSEEESDFSSAEQQYSTRIAEGGEIVSPPDRILYNEYYDENDEFDFDDYYDYAYSVRIKRFHRPVYGAGYYDDCYTNLYWYTYDPWVWGMSVYLGYDWWWWDWYGGPYFSLGYNWGWGSINWHWGFPYSGWYYYPHFFYHYPWYPWYYGWGAYPYYIGWWNGFWFGHYYNSHDPNSYYYGRRVSRHETNGAASGGTFGEYYENYVNNQRRGGQGTNGVTQPSGQGSESSLTQRRIQAAGVNQQAVKDKPGEEKNLTQGTLNERRISASESTQVTPKTDQPAVTPARIRSGEENLAAPKPSNEQSEGNVSNRRISGNVNQTAEQSQTQDSRLRQTQENYAKPQASPANPQQYDYNRYRRTSPATNPEQLARPKTQGNQNDRPVRTYTPPTYSRPRSSNEYTTPRRITIPQQSEQPSQMNKGVKRETQKSSERNKSYTPPSSSRPNYSVPSSSNSHQNNSSRPSYNSSSSQERHSSSSFSSPSRSSSNSGGGSSSSSRSGSGRRR